MRTHAMKQRGFTLIELMVVLVIIALLAMIAYPSYISTVQKSRRAEGKSELLAAAVQMQRYFTERSTFATATLGGSGVYRNTTENGHYTLTLSNLAVNTFTLSAAPVGAQSTDPCGTLTYNEQGVKGVTGGTKTAEECWR